MNGPAGVEQKVSFRDDIGRYLVLMPNRTVACKLRLIVYTPALWIIFFYRIGHKLVRLAASRRLFKLISIPYGFFYFVLKLLVGIDIPLEVKIGPGLYIGHTGGIFLHPDAIIGANCNLSQGVTIGEGGRAGARGVPHIGDRVYIAPGAKVFGNITVGNDVAVGANAVVTKDVADSAVVGGVPAKVLSMKGSADFVVLP